MSHTNRARLRLVLSPLLLPLMVIAYVPLAIWLASKAFWRHADFAGAIRHWYRGVWRVAIYGSVWDDVDESGYPKAWSRG